jgi:hypothetical protein
LRISHRTRKHLLYFKASFLSLTVSSSCSGLYFPVVINHYFYSKLNHVCFSHHEQCSNFHSIYLQYDAIKCINGSSRTITLVQIIIFSRFVVA